MASTNGWKELARMRTKVMMSTPVEKEAKFSCGGCGTEWFAGDFKQHTYKVGKRCPYCKRVMGITAQY